MKKHILFLSAVAIMFSCQNNNPDTDKADNDNLSEPELNEGKPVEADEVTNDDRDTTSEKSFGKDINAEGAISMDELNAQLAQNDSVTAKVRTVPTEVCQKMGCWMIVQLPNGEKMRVKFKDHAFFVPKDLSGTEVVIEGVAFKEVETVEDLQHYAEDAGKSEEEIAKITEPKEVYSFRADGLRII